MLRGRTRSKDTTGPQEGAPSSISKRQALFYTLALAFTSSNFEPSMKISTGNPLINDRSPDSSFTNNVPFCISRLKLP